MIPPNSPLLVDTDADRFAHYIREVYTAPERRGRYSETIEDMIAVYRANPAVRDFWGAITGYNNWRVS